MIKKLIIKNVATYKSLEIEPKKINYIYGGNGTGKTTLSRFLNNPDNLTNGNIIKDSTDLEILTYNKDFVDKNFDDNSAIKGIFTIGQESKEIELQIQEKTKEKIQIDEQIIQKNNTVDKLTQDALVERNSFYEECWLIKKQYDKYQQCFTGFRDSKEKFAEKCKEIQSVKIIDTFENIDEEYKLLYETELKIFDRYDLIDTTQFDILESDSILGTSIVCIQNSEYSELINKLKNSDWVKDGLKYLGDDLTCPFCQQKLSTEIKNGLFEIFDETYNNQLKLLSKFNESYIQATNKILEYIDNIINSNITFLEKNKLINLHSELKIVINNNKQIINKKISTPSEVIKLESVQKILALINEEINQYNQKIDKNNDLANNQANSRNNLSNRAWQIVANNILFDRIKQHKEKISGINNGVFKIKNEIKLKKDKCNELEVEINKLQATTSSIDNAINEINKALKAFAFTGFSLLKAEDGRNYKIIREDGSDVRETLSEGEQRFITFLYFYQLIKGNIEAKLSTKQKIIVIDDPISSLDSNILFIVSTLVKNIISDCLAGNNLIEQVFIMTHNIYFHQEIAFKGARQNRSSKTECFWTIRKKNNVSNIELSEDNLIQTSYELLWQEIKDTSKSSSVTIFNTLRRILEYYFNIIGKIDYEKCINNMDGEDKILCKSLLAFINVNSHIVNDDFVIIYDEDTISKYIKVFEKIFEITGHKAHYDMMMGNKKED